MPHEAITKPVVVTSVLTAGYAGNLAKGQLAVVKNKARKGMGAEVVSDFAGMTDQELISFRVGEVTTPNNLRIAEVPSKSTGFFPIGSIVDIKAYAPTNVTLKVDHIEMGFNGLPNSKGLEIPEGKSALMDIVVYGQVASMFFGQSHYTITKQVTRMEGETMQEVIYRLVKELNEDAIPTANGWASTQDKLSQFLEIGVIDSEKVAATGVDSVFSTIAIPDNGDSNALAEVQAAYPMQKVVRTARNGNTSTYTILHLVSDVLTAFTKVSVDTQIKGCEDCLAGYSLVEGGFVYHVSLEDDGVDSKATVQALPNAVAATAIKFGNKNGKGTYSVVLSQVLTNAQVLTFTNANPTAEMRNRGEVKAICANSTSVVYNWVDGETCTASTRDFSITLADNECGETRLAELQAAYPDLVIAEGGFTGVSTRAVTLSGASGDATLKINGVDYTTAYITSPTATAAAFVTAHAANILTATAATVSSAGAIITIAAPTGQYPTVASVAGGMTEAIGAIQAPVVAQVGGCKRVYSTTVPTNLVCDECSDIFLQPFYAEAPVDYDGAYWMEKETAFSPTAKMGIFIKGKPMYLTPEAYEEDFIPHMETSLKVRSASFGVRQDDVLNYTGTSYDVNVELAEVIRIQFAQDVHNQSQDFFGAERMGDLHYTGKKIHKANLFARQNLSQERLLNYNKRMVQYHVQYTTAEISQMAGRSTITHDFMIIVEYGRHQVIEQILGRLASRNGIKTSFLHRNRHKAKKVQYFPKRILKSAY